MAEPFLGEIRMVGFNFAPQGWALCNGQLLSISQNTALFSLLGTTYGGNGQNTFALPDLQGRVPIHQGQGPGLSPYTIGQMGGEEAHTLIQSEMPQHNHSARAHAGAGNSNVANGNVWSKDAGVSSATYSSATQDGLMSPTAISTTGGSQPHNNLQPFLTINFIIAMQGIYPSRS
jgi:microcystin-dependent protein